MSLNLHRGIFVLALAALALPVVAQTNDAPPPPADSQDQTAPPPPRRGRGDHLLKQLTAKLGLSDAQVQQIKGILKTQMQQAKALRQDDSLSDDDRRAKFGALQQSAHDQIRAILTPDQQKIFDTLPAPGQGHHGPPPGAEGDAPPAPPPST
jgi:Spy/CpxP family protein refolding chaperone